MSGKLQLALSRLNAIYEQKKDNIPLDKVKEVEQQMEEKNKKEREKEQGGNSNNALNNLKDKQTKQKKVYISEAEKTQNELDMIDKSQPNIIYKESLPPIFHPLQAKDKKTIRDEKSERKRRQLCMRKAAGSIWEDQTLADWPDNDYRLFCGNLGNEVSDEVLANAFRKYASFARARVIRDKRTMKTKGYGFVSFLNPNDYLKAFNEMNGKYVGNRPIKISKGKWMERSFQNKKKDGLDAQFVKPKIRKIKRIQPQPT